MTASKPDRCPRPRVRRLAVGAAFLIVGLCGLGCGKKEPPRPAAPTTRDTAPSPARSAARPATRAPQPQAPIEQPTPAEPVATVTAETPTPASALPAAVTDTTAPAPREPQTLEEIVDELVVTAPDPAPLEARKPPRPPEPLSSAEHTRRAEAALDGGDCATALEHFGQARRQKPHDLHLRLREAAAYRRCGWPGEALALLDELDARTRALEAVAAEIAEAHRMLDEPGQAAMAWELRYIFYPQAWRAAAHAAEAWMAAGEHQPAQWWYEQARRAAPDTPEIRALTAVIQSAAVSDR